MAFQIQIHRTKSIEILNKNQKQNGSKKWNFYEPHNQKNYCVPNKDYGKNCRETKPFCSNLIKQRTLGKKLLNVVCPPLGFFKPHSLSELKAKKSEIYTNPLRQWVLWGPFSIITHKSPLGKRGPHSLNRLQAKNSEISMKPLRQWVLWGPFFIITLKSTP